MLAFLATFAVPAIGEAQSYVVGGNTPPSVSVNSDVIESLGQPPTLPQLLQGSLRFPEVAPQPTGAKPQPARTLRLKIPKSAKKVVKKPAMAKAKAVATAAPAAPAPAPAAPAPAAASPVTPAVASPTVASSAVATPPATPAVAVTPAPPVEATTPAPSPPTQIGAATADAPKPASASAPVSGGQTPVTPATLASVAPKAAPAKTAAEPANNSSVSAPPPPNDRAPPQPSSALTRMKDQPAKTEPASPPAGGTTQPSSQTAAVHPIPTAGEMKRLVFAGESTALPEDAKATLQNLGRRMLTSEMMRLQLLAYASGDDANASKARRVSLSRALAVRAFLIEQGVASTAIDVRALGNKAADGPLDRVDVVVVPQ